MVTEDYRTHYRAPLSEWQLTLQKQFDEFFGEHDKVMAEVEAATRKQRTFTARIRDAWRELRT